MAQGEGKRKGKSAHDMSSICITPSREVVDQGMIIHTSRRLARLELELGVDRVLRFVIVLHTILLPTKHFTKTIPALGPRLETMTNLDLGGPLNQVLMIFLVGKSRRESRGVRML